MRKNKPLTDVKDELDRVEPEAGQMYDIGLTFVKHRQWEQAKRYFEDALAAYQLDRDEARLPLARALIAQAMCA